MVAAGGIDVRMVFISDDVASAPAGETDKRRGIAGDIVVFKIAGAAAERGMTLDEVERVARKANAATRSMGVALEQPGTARSRIADIRYPAGGDGGRARSPRRGRDQPGTSRLGGRRRPSADRTDPL